MPRVASRTIPAQLSTAGVVAALILAGCGGGSQRSTAAPADQVEVVRLESQLSATALLQGARAPGSEIVFTGMLFQPSGKTAIGRFQGACTRTAPGNGAVFQCLLTYIVPNGVIYGQSQASSQGPANGAITGGTGKYANVRGTFKYRATDSPRAALEMSLTR